MTKNKKNANKLHVNVLANEVITESTASNEVVNTETNSVEAVIVDSDFNAAFESNAAPLTEINKDVNNVIADETEKPKEKKPKDNVKEVNPLDLMTKAQVKNDYLTLYSELVSFSAFLRHANKPIYRNDQRTKNLLMKYNLSLDFQFTYDYFNTNCPKMVIGEKELFAKWVNITDKQPANDNEAYNRTIKVGKIGARHEVKQTLKPYNFGKASFEVYVNLFADVANEIVRVRKSYLADKAEKEKVEKELKKSQNTAVSLATLLAQQNILNEKIARARALEAEKTEVAEKVAEIKEVIADSNEKEITI